uniref:PIR2-like helical domain-containing protein n=1 Tax=Oryza punctata TaxID=4537 RepID=A0A0E0KHT4_ORYPU
MPALVPRLLKAGLCVGFWDPVSNIVVNTITYKKRVPVVTGGDSDGKAAASARRRRRKALSRIVADTSNVGGCESERALTCAAIAGWHPNPKSLVERVYSIASQIGEASSLLRMEGCLSCSVVKNISRLVKHRQGPVDLVGATVLPRSLEIEEKQPPFVRMKSLKSVLLDKIYGLYLDVLACLPMYGLRRRYHRGLLKAGHCYGPFENPVHNIVLNTVWYETMFPPQENVSVQMICSRSLVRVACRSLNALVAYLRACFCTISEQQLCVTFQTVPVLSEEASMTLSCIQEEFKAEQSFIFGKVNDALKKYNQEPGNYGRCYHCECEGAKIVHPDLEKYNGRTNFLEMARNKSSGTTTQDVITRCEYLHDAVDICEEDCVCFDASRDVECAEFLNSRAANKD